METKNIICKLGELLAGASVWFDSEYSENYEEDRPILTIDGKAIQVCSAYISFTNALVVNAVDLETEQDCMEVVTLDEVDKLNQEEVMYLLHEMYYESDCSIEIGDWEQDFLPLC